MQVYKKDVADIVMAVSKKYDFHTQDILVYLNCWMGNGIIVNNKDEPVRTQVKIIKIEDIIRGFFITDSYDKKILLKYVFIIPEYRREGIFTAIIDDLKGQCEEISIDTCEKPMIHACNKLDFKFLRTCDTGKELCFVWKK